MSTHLTPHRKPWAWLGCVLGLSLAGCSQMNMATYAQQQPRFDLKQYFSGPVEAWGMFQKRDGTVVKRFHVRLVGQWQNGIGTLDETFTYSDGSTSKRVWTLEEVAPNQFRGRAADVQGEAQGELSGPVFRWRYTLNLPVDDTTYAVQMDDTLIMVDEKTVLNRATMSKWGITVGEVTLSFHKP